MFFSCLMIQKHNHQLIMQQYISCSVIKKSRTEKKAQDLINVFNKAQKVYLKKAINSCKMKQTNKRLNRISLYLKVIFSELFRASWRSRHIFSIHSFMSQCLLSSYVIPDWLQYVKVRALCGPHLCVAEDSSWWFCLFVWGHCDAAKWLKDCLSDD